MTRTRSLGAAAALALGALACTEAQSTLPGVRLRQPSAVAVFQGRTLAAPTAIHPYLAVASSSRNDLSIVDAATNLPVVSPIKLRTLVVPVGDRPSLLAAASLGDGTLEQPRPDLLVAVSAGDSVLQLVETWDVANVVHSDPAEAPAPAPLAVDLGHDVVALAPLPSVPGTARIAAALADRRIAVVEYARGADGESIDLVSSTPLAAQLPFQAQAIAAMPDDPAVAGIQTALYVATLDEVAPGVFGVAEISADLATVRALGARAPTRLVAAARLRERSAPDNADSGDTAFGAEAVPRVYAVLDESACGPGKPIGCGIVSLDPDPALPSGAQAIPGDFPDYAGTGYFRMPYRIPMRVGGRPLALAVSGPPAVRPPDVAGEPAWDALPDGFMRVYTGTVARATTAVAAVATDDRFVYFLDLGRFETVTLAPVVAGTAAGVSGEVALGGWVENRRLWFQDGQGSFAATAADAAKLVTTTPGFTPDEAWAVTYQGILRDLDNRAGEAGEYAAGQPWLALQAGHGPAGGVRILNEVVQLWHPALGVRDRQVAPAEAREGDIVVIKAKGVPAPCVGTDPPGTSDPGEDDEGIENEFELQVDDLLAPTPAYPGGAVTLAPRTADRPEWSACYAALVAASSGTSLLTGLSVTVRASEYHLAGSGLGYAGRAVLDPVLGAGHYRVTLAYPTGQTEEELAALCPVADWTGGLPAPACDAACRTACEQLVLARKTRRVQDVSADCETDPAKTAACRERWGDVVADAFPLVAGTTALDLRFGIETRLTGTADVDRRMTLRFSSVSGAAPLRSRGDATAPYGANGVVAFDRSPIDPLAGYRFFVSYPADFVLDTTPSQTPTPRIVIR